MSKNNIEKTTSGWFVARWLLGFFGVMFIANIIFVWFALSTHTGNQTRSAYEEGLNHNQLLEAARQQRLLGWSFDVDIMSDGTLLVSLVDKAGAPLLGADIEAMLFNPTSDQDDRTIKVVNMTNGKFSLRYDGVAHGQWQLRLKIRNDNDKAEFRRTLVLP